MQLQIEVLYCEYLVCIFVMIFRLKIYGPLLLPRLNGRHSISNISKSTYILQRNQHLSYM